MNNMKTLITLSTLLFTVTFAFAQGHNNPCDNPKKVLVCHYPPGNPENVQEICISQNAVEAHLAHGCRIGSCGRPDPTRLMDPSLYEETEFVTVYPNPFTNKLSIEMVFEEATQAEVAIYDVKGTLVAQPFKGMTDSSFIMDYNTDVLATGMYIVRVVTPENVHTFKLSKNL